MTLSRAYYRSRTARTSPARRSVTAVTPRAAHGPHRDGDRQQPDRCRRHGIPAADVTSSAGAVVAVANANRPASAVYTPAYGQSVAGATSTSAHGDHDDDHRDANADSTYLRADGTTAGASSQTRHLPTAYSALFVQETGIVQVDDDYAILASDAWIIVTDGSHTATLPDATVSAGRQYMITNGHENTGDRHR